MILLCVLSDLYPQPRAARVSHVSGDYAARSAFDASCPTRCAARRCSELDEALSSELIEIELQAVLQAGSMTRARQCQTPRALNCASDRGYQSRIKSLRAAWWRTSAPLRKADISRNNN